MTLKSGDYPWCIMETVPDEDSKQTFFCQRCKQIHKFDAVSMSVNEFLEMSEAFCLLHKNCKGVINQ